MATNDNNPDQGAGKGGTRQSASAQTTASAEEKDPNVIWVISNRQDDRVVLHERDPRHPGGEAFVGGAAPDKVYRTAEIARLLHSGEIIEIPEPPDGPKKPKDVAPVISQTPPAMPGQPIRLGRKLDPDLVPAGAQAAVKQKQQQAPREIKSRAGVPPEPRAATPTTTETNRD